MSEVTHYLIDSEGEFAPAPHEFTEDHVQEHQHGRFIPITVDQMDAIRLVLSRDGDAGNVWGLSVEGDITMVEYIEGQGLEMDVIKSQSIPYQEGFFLAMYYQETAERAFGLTQARTMEEPDDVHLAFYTVPFRVSNHEFAHSALSTQGLRVTYDPSDPLEFQVAANHLPGNTAELVKMFTSVLAVDHRVSLMILRVNKSDVLASKSELLVITHDGRTEELELSNLAQLMLTSPWNPTATELARADEQIAQLRGDPVPTEQPSGPTDVQIDKVMAEIGDAVECYQRYYGLPKQPSWLEYYRQKLRDLFQPSP